MVLSFVLIARASGDDDDDDPDDDDEDEDEEEEGQEGEEEDGTRLVLPFSCYRSPRFVLWNAPECIT